MADTNLVTGKVRFNYPYVFKPREEEGDEDARYTVDILIKKSDKETIKDIRAAIWAAVIAGKDKLKLKGQLRDLDDLPDSFSYPLKDGDRKKNAGEEYEGCYYLTPWSKNKPNVVGPDPRENITDSREFYSGCYGRISLNFKMFDYKGKLGVSAYINNIQKTSDGPRLDNARSAFQDFDDGFVDDDNYDDKPSRNRGRDDFEDERPKKRRSDDDYEEDRPRKHREDDFEDERPKKRKSWLD